MSYKEMADQHKDLFFCLSSYSQPLPSTSPLSSPGLILNLWIHKYMGDFKLTAG